jgi:archaellum biogenesis ATPase FlaH
MEGFAEAVVETGRKPRVVSPFKFPPSLSPKHEEELRKRAISKEFALASGVRTAADNELRELNFQASLAHEERSKGMQGLCFEYCDLSRNPLSYRIKPDQSFSLSGKRAKYLSRAGDKVHAYFPHTTTSEMAANPKVNLVITEGEFKTLSIAENIVPIAGRATCAVGLQGVNGGWHRDKIMVTLPTGEKEARKEGAPHLIDDLEAVEWKKRTVYICFDSDVGGKANAAEFKLNKRAGAWGAEYTLAQLLRAKGAEVRIVILPPRIDGTKYGVDDYIADRGPYESLKLLYNSWVVERDPDEVLYAAEARKIELLSTEVLAKAEPRPTSEFVIDGIVRPGSTTIVGGPPGCGKSIMAEYACLAVATGMPWMGWRRTKQGKAIYIQTELTRDELEERSRELGLKHENFSVIDLHPGYPLNFWEPDGFNKKRETGNREKWLALLEKIRSFNPSLICFDVLADFTTCSLIDPEAASHIMDIMIRTAQICQAGVYISHHLTKRSARDRRYESAQDDLWGSYKLTARAGAVLVISDYIRSDGTHKCKLAISKLRHKGIYENMEVQKLDPWQFVPWEDIAGNHGGKLTNEDRLLGALEGGRLKFRDALERSGLKSATFYRTFDKLEDKGRVKRIGNVYCLADDEGENSD